MHVAVAHYQAGRGNPVGTERQLEKAQRRLGPYAPSHGGLDVGALLHSVDEARGRFPELPPPVVDDALPGGPALERALRFMVDMELRVATCVDEFEYGTVYTDPDRPVAWDLNFARLGPDAGEPGAAALADAVDRAQAAAGHRSHRKLFVHDAGAGARLSPGFRALGWEVERALVMVLGETPSAGSDAVEELDPDLLGPSLVRFTRAEDPSLSDEAVRQLASFGEAMRRDTDVRLFAYLEDGVPVSWCELFSHGGAAQVEGVATLVEHRGRGFASSVVAAAARASRAAGDELTFLVIDEPGGPQALYERVGFTVVGREYAFFRRPSS